jgi:hypothetical protein
MAARQSEKDIRCCLKLPTLLERRFFANNLASRITPSSNTGKHAS